MPSWKAIVAIIVVSNLAVYAIADRVSYHAGWNSDSRKVVLDYQSSKAPKKRTLEIQNTRLN